MNTVPVKWAAQLPHVREVSLRGTADVAFWKERLAREGLLPAEKNGRAQVLIIAADGCFHGIRFRELSFSVIVTPPDEGSATRDAAFLVRAFNSNRFFAFCERTFFSTPYDHGHVRVSTSAPASVELSLKGRTVFAAQMGAAPREPARVGADGWEGPVFLPGKAAGNASALRFFVARIRGETRAYPFDAAVDSLAITPSGELDLFAALAASRFMAEEWSIRPDAWHAKSKTSRYFLTARPGDDVVR